MTVYANVGHILLKRGNTVQSTAYTGPVGELTLDTGLFAVRLHNGVTPGGNVLLENASQFTANLGTAAENITTLFANAATQTTLINAINANVTAANAAITSLTSNAAIQASLLDTLTGNAATQAQVLDTLTSNAATQATSLTTLLSNAVTQQTSLTDLVANAAAQAQDISNATGTYGNANVEAYIGANIGSFYTYANLNYRTSSYANANVAGYLASGNDSTITSLQNSIVYIQGTLSGIPGQALATSAQLDAANAAIIGANVAWQANAASQAAQITGANAAIVTANTALKTYVDTQLSTLTNGASAALDTLLEIGTALGNNANFSSVMVTWLGNVTANITGANVNISALQSNTGALQNQITGANAAIVTANTAMKAYVDANTSSQSASINSLNSAQITISGQIGTLQSNAVSQQSAITTLQSQVNGPVFIATQTTGQSLSTIGSITQLPLIFNSIERASPNGLYNASTGVFTPNVAGYYQVSVGCAATTANASANISTFYYTTLLYKNTAAVASGSIDRPQTISGLNTYITASSQVSREIYLNGTTDYICANIVYYNGSSGSGWNTNITSYTIVPNYFQAVWVRGT